MSDAKQYFADLLKTEGLPETLITSAMDSRGRNASGFFRLSKVMRTVIAICGTGVAHYANLAVEMADLGFEMLDFTRQTEVNSGLQSYWPWEQCAWFGLYLGFYAADELAEPLFIHERTPDRRATSYMKADYEQMHGMVERYAPEELAVPMNNKFLWDEWRKAVMVTNEGNNTRGKVFSAEGPAFTNLKLFKNK